MYKFEVPLSEEIWKKKHKYKDDKSVEDSWRRIASAISSVEDSLDRAHWAEEFYNLLYGFTFMPGGRTSNGAGTKHNYLLNCGSAAIYDSVAGEKSIARTAERTAYMSKCSYGVGMNFSPIRPKGSPLSGGGFASGVISFMRVFDTWCSVIQDGGGRRAALIGLLEVNHPDIFDFIDAKRQEGVLTQFNISVGITQEFIDAVSKDSDFDLVWNGTIYKTVKAREIWEKLCYSGWMYNDPGLFMLDTVNKYNNLYYKYKLDAVNPCGEIPLPSGNDGSSAGGVCDLGNINLTKYIKAPFAEYADWRDNFDSEKFINDISVAVRFLDNVLDVSNYPYDDLKEAAQSDRRIGLNVVAGLGSFLAMLKVPYDTPEARIIAQTIQQSGTYAAYNASIELAIEKGSFKSFDKDKYLQGEFIKTLPKYIQTRIEEYGIRNSSLMTIPPVGTNSLISGNISNGLEPIFCLEYDRNIRQLDGTTKTESVEDYAWALWKKQQTGNEKFDSNLYKTDFFKTSMEIDPLDHIRMQACLQRYIDGSISKTVNLPESYSLEDYKYALMFAIDSGLKGYTTFRSGTREGVLVEKKEDKKDTKEVVNSAIHEVTIQRPRILDGKTYKIKDTHGNVYVTLNYYDVDKTKKPWEIFIFSSNENQEMYAALGKTLSAIMRRCDDISFIIEDLKSIKSSTETGGYFTQEYGFIKSKPQHLGYIIEEFINCLNGNNESKLIEYKTCPECKERTYIKEGGCTKCTSCGYSECG